MGLSDEVEINLTPILDGKDLVIIEGNKNIGYVVSETLGETLAKKIIADLGYKLGDRVPCRIYIPIKKS